MANAKLKPVLITWADITSFNTWISPTDAISKRPMTIQSVGWLVGKDKSYVHIAMNHADDGDVGVVKVIPAGNISKMKVLK